MCGVVQSIIVRIRVGAHSPVEHGIDINIGIDTLMVANCTTRLHLDDVAANVCKKRYEHDIDTLMDHLDADGDGSITVLEFLKGMVKLANEESQHTQGVKFTRKSLHDIPVMDLNNEDEERPR